MTTHNESHHKMLDQSKIVQAAFEVLQLEGYKSITIRKVAEKLGIKSASLYWHIKNKKELLELVADEICKDIQFPVEKENWDEQLRQFANQWRDQLLSIKDAAVVLSETAPTTPYRIQLIERLHQIFINAGMNKENAFSSLWLYNIYITSFILEEYRFLGISKETPHSSTPTHLTIPDMEKEFQFGLDTMLMGLKEKIE
ncbi:transcriptional regulator, TetR family [Gracilibacillus orientalis]|uniref:Transcriptional regulator, TetR family n=1 Tax=Gracilibacillus orientalis TaxID=334253 RepID=A0A1I4LMS0_9BACI|nr:TetR/AcrR family transcriptional regulator C-terminal domain-containing protein [Gracilibacillus orientalis]SFL92304.1 transcriptional regulator, TetR family [Gracilibacillus orientalis]